MIFAPVISFRAPPFGITFINADVAADFLRTRLAEIKAQASAISPGNPDVVPLNVEDATGFEGFGQAENITITRTEIADFRAAVDALRAALSEKGVSRLRLDELNAFPDLALAGTAGELIAKLENLLRIYDTMVRGARAGGRPSALPIAVGIGVGFVAIGALLFYFVTRK